MFLLFICCPFYLYSQQEGWIETDRPDQTECPFIVKRGYLQGEIGFNRQMLGGNATYFLPTSLFKIGLSKHVELRYTSLLYRELQKTTFQTESFGAKVHLFSGDAKWIPRTALIVQYHWNNQNRDQSERNTTPHSLGEIILTHQNSINDTFGIGYNFGAEFHNDGHVEGIYRVAPNVVIGKKGYAYVEVFGRFPASLYADYWLDGGIAYYLNPDVKLDFSAGKSLRSADEMYLALGLSFRVKIF